MPIKKIRDGKAVIGTMLRALRNPAIVPMAANAGLDFLFVDSEHGAYSLNQVADLALAARSHGLGLFVRVPELSRAWVSGVLDSGASGVMVPMIETVEQARLLAGWAKFPPLGERGLSALGPHTNYQMPGDLSGHMAEHNDRTLSIAQIETVRGSEASGAIAAVAGIDALLVGPHDLAVSLGQPGRLDSPEHAAATAKIASAASDHGKIFALHGSVDLIQRWVPYGLKLIVSSIDVSLITTAMSQLSRDLRAITCSAPG